MEFDWGIFEVSLVTDFSFTDFSYTCKTIYMEVSKYLTFVNAEKNWFFLNKMFRLFLEVNYCKKFLYLYCPFGLKFEPVYGDVPFLLKCSKREAFLFKWMLITVSLLWCETSSPKPTTVFFQLHSAACLLSVLLL